MLHDCNLGCFHDYNITIIFSINIKMHEFISYMTQLRKTPWIPLLSSVSELPLLATIAQSFSDIWSPPRPLSVAV